MAGSLSALEESQNTYEQRFNCIICLCPKLRMIYGTCQHRICEHCLYDDNSSLIRPSLLKCPVCQMDAAFPVIRPDIPEDNVELMKCLGVRSCVYEGCNIEMWEWELEEHVKQCPLGPNTPLTPRQTRRYSYSDNTSPSRKRRSSRKSTTSTRSAILCRLRSFRHSTSR